MRGIILDKGEKYFSDLRRVFSAINNIQNNYNWLITDHMCYPKNEKHKRIFSVENCWISGEELTKIINNENFQWIWGVFSGFKMSVSKEEVLKYRLPKAEGYSGFWENPVSIQHPLAEVEIVAWDSSMTILISRIDGIVDKFKENMPLSRDLEEYNSY